MNKRKRSKKTETGSKATTTTGSPRRSTYVRRPEHIPDPVADRAVVVLAVLNEDISVTEGAEMLGLSRVQMQTLKNKAARALLESLTPQPSGRPRKDEATQLKEELAAATEENQRLAQELDKTQGVISELVSILRDQTAQTQALQRKVRERRQRSTQKTEDDDSDPRIRLARVARLVERGAPRSLAARAVLSSPSTVRRWARRERLGRALVGRRGPGPRQPPTPAQRKEVEARVRRLNGGIGAPSLGKAAGISRRQASAIKEETLTAIERERKQQAARVTVSEPGVVRSIDAMHLETHEGKAVALIVADGAVPYRTSAAVTDCYDGIAVEQVLGADFDLHGAPLVLRLDRAACQRTPGVRRLLEDRGVLRLHGPTHYPQYYGQLERQNREHRLVLGDCVLSTAETVARLHQGCAALNYAWPRRSLGWRTPGELWDARQPIALDRQALRDEVTERAARILEARTGDLDSNAAWRFAVEHALTQRGLLHIKPGGGR